MIFLEEYAGKNPEFSAECFLRFEAEVLVVIVRSEPAR